MLYSFDDLIRVKFFVYLQKLKMKKSSDPQLISYQLLRRSIGILGILIPFILVIGSVLLGSCTPIEDSISAYYHTASRDLFVGVLCIVGFFLFAYNGYDKRDKRAGKLACFFVLGVAFTPTYVEAPFSDCMLLGTNVEVLGTIHLLLAGGFFLMLAYFCLKLFRLRKDKDFCTLQKVKRDRMYKICGITILGSIALILLYSTVLQGKYPVLDNSHPVFWLEVVALWAFGISWITKGEILYSDGNNPEMVDLRKV